MSEFKARFTGLMPLFRRSSTTTTSPNDKSPSLVSTNPLRAKGNQSKTSLVSPRRRKTSVGPPVAEQKVLVPKIPPLELPLPTSETQFLSGDSQRTPDTSLESARATPLEKPKPACPQVTLEEPTPELSATLDKATGHNNETGFGIKKSLQRPEAVPRKQSIAHNSQGRFITTLLESGGPNSRPTSRGTTTDYFSEAPAITANMLHRKIWVRRAGSSATMIQINEEDLVDDVREIILKKYTNSLGRTFDSPDVTLRILPRDEAHRHSQGERTLGPEEPMLRTLDAYFPGGQTVEEALIIDVPKQRTPRHSPRIAMPYYVSEDLRPVENGTDYFPPMPIAAQHSPHLPSNLSVVSGQSASHHPTMHSIAVLNTGQIPPLPSPGSRSARHSSHRPKYGRTQTTSPTVVSVASSQHQGTQRFPELQIVSGLANLPEDVIKLPLNSIPNPPPLPTPPIPSDAQPHRVSTPPPTRASSPRPNLAQKKSKQKVNQPKLPAGLLDGAVPPINVLIVEDNIINLKLLEAFMKRLKVRWHTAMNGQEAVKKWRGGGFHLVLMDIQLPIMNGLEATKEIRRLERVNNIGVFSNSASSTPAFPNGGESQEDAGKTGEDDNLMNTALFKSPVIIVALTASSLQSDRHEALAAGCNDFLTKVFFPSGSM